MRQTLKNVLWPALGLALAVLVAPNSKADNFNTSLASPPGVYFGTGNANTNFTTNTSLPNLELGLSVITRYIGPIDPGNSNVYTVLPGLTTVPGKTGSTWGFDFSVNTQDGGGSATVSDYTYSLTVDDLTSGISTTFDPSAIPDNALNRFAGFQNSEAISFTGPGLPDLYEITLQATPVGGGAAADVTVFANATGVPEPSSVVLLFTLAFGVFFLGRRRMAATKRTI
jgi:hypothetical protein